MMRKKVVKLENQFCDRLKAARKKVSSGAVNNLGMGVFTINQS